MRPYMLKVLILQPNRRTANIWAPLYKRITETHPIDLTVLMPKMSEIARREWESSIYFPGKYRLIELNSWLNQYSDMGHTAPLILSPLLYRHLRANKYHLIHSLGEAGYISTFQTSLYKLISPRTFKYCIRAAQNVYKTYPFPFSFFERVSYKVVDSIICNGVEQGEVLREKGYRGRVDLIPLGVDTNLFVPKDATSLRETLGLKFFTFGYIGKLIEQKGVDDLISAFGRMPEDTNLFIIGSGNYVARLQGMKDNSPAGNRIIIMDHVHHGQVVDYLNCMDVLVLPSKFSPASSINDKIPIPWKEQFGRVLTEAMACRIGVIGSDSGSIPTVIGNAGLLFASGNRNDLWGKMMLFYNDRQLLRELAEEGWKRARDKYSWEIVGKQIIDLWLELACDNMAT